MTSYQDLFESYLADMRKAIAASRQWWDALAAAETARHGDGARAREAVTRRWPFGAASHPFVIAAYRDWALRCQELNDAAEARDEEVDDDEDDESDWDEDEEVATEDDESQDLATLEGPIEPRALLIDMLPGRADDVGDFLADFVFDPVGLDKDDRWV